MRLSILQAALLAAATLVAVPASADPDKDESGKGRWHGKHEGKEKYWDGNCKVERKWKDGEYKEERKCRAPRHASAPAGPPPVEPTVVISLPPIVVY